MKEGAQNKVIRPFGKHEIALHIDDGCMGGGTSVPVGSIDPIVYQPRQSGDNNDYEDYLWDGDSNHNGVIDRAETGRIGYFTANREHIFHYCLMAQNLEWDSQTWGGLANGAYLGHFSIADATVINTNQQSRHFMHELGHTIGLPDVGHMGDDYWSSMNEDKRFYTGYEDNEWDIITNQGGISSKL